MCAMRLLRASLLAALGVIPASEGFARPKATSAKTAAPATVTVDYGIALAGIPIGTAQVSGLFETTRYRMDVSARLTGLVGAVTGGMGSARANGLIAEGPQPNTFAISTKTSNSGIAVRMALARGNVTPIRGDAAPDRHGRPRAGDPGQQARHRRSGQRPDDAGGEPGRAHRPGQLQPHHPDLRRRDALQRGAELRRDAQTSRSPAIPGRSSSATPAIRPLPGIAPTRPGVKFMEDNRDMSVWLAPVEGTRVLLPVRIAVRTTLGHQHHRGDPVEPWRGAEPGGAGGFGRSMTADRA